MAVPNDSSVARIRVCVTINGTYTNVGYVRSAALERASEGDTTLKWLGGESVRSGDRTVGGTIPVWWDDGDTTGQTIVYNAWVSGAQIFFQFCPKGAGASASVQQFGAIVTAAPLSFDSEGEAVEGSFTIKGDVSTLSTVVLAP